MTMVTVWLLFLVSAGFIVVAAIQLAKYGDIIALRTGLGGMFVGVILMAAATSLPEVLTTISSINQGVLNLAAGNLLGSNMFNMFLLAILDMTHRKERLLRKAALKHALSGSLAVFLIGLVVFFVMADIQASVGWIGLDSLFIILAYVIAMRLIQKNNQFSASAVSNFEIPKGTPSLGRGLMGFGIAALALVFITPVMVRNSAAIAELTGLGTTFIGTTLVALVTSLPELVTTLAAVRLGANDMAIGNLFGSNLFNIFALGLTDIFYLEGRFIGMIDPGFLLIGMLGLIMTSMGLIGNLARLERRILFIEIDSLALICVYFGGLWLLLSRGVAP
ncbi:MAG: sodium:calcium antiporter [Anaerolineales bacterium]|nr:sodium:calcium antiporter [Anaerolineales bacterium]